MSPRHLAALVLALTVAACSSTPDAPEPVEPTGGPSDIRAELAVAIVGGTSCRSGSGSGCDAFRRDVDAWTSRLPDSAICAAARRAHDRPLLSLGIDIAAAARREIVVDLTGRHAAVYTKAAGDLVDDRAHLYFGARSALPVDEESVSSRVAVLEPEVARKLRAMIGPDGSPYGEAYALSTIATRKLAATVAGASGSETGIVFSGKDATASAVVAWWSPFAPLTVKALLLALVGDAPPSCASVKTTAIHVLDYETNESDDFDEVLASWLETTPSGAVPATENAPVAASCATDPEMGCGASVCNRSGDSFCCTAPIPVTKPCTYDSDCGEGSSCVMASNDLSLTCADASGGACAAVEAAAETPRTVSLMYEGTCAFLRANSKWSRNAPAGEVMWGCEGLGECSDSEHWVAGPAKSYCGKTVEFCKGGKCTTAKVRDISVAKGWEGSQGVMNGLGAPYGTTKVTVRVL